MKMTPDERKKTWDWQRYALVHEKEHLGRKKYQNL